MFCFFIKFVKHLVSMLISTHPIIPITESRLEKEDAALSPEKRKPITGKVSINHSATNNIFLLLFLIFITLQVLNKYNFYHACLHMFSEDELQVFVF